MARLTLSGIQKYYGDTHILKGIDLDIADGEFMVFVGPSGCGKSTLLRMIAGLEKISDGEMRLDGAVINNLEPVERGMAMVFQSYALYPHMTVAENMGFSLRIAKRPKAEIREKVLAAARVLQLEPYVDRLPKDLSGGQRQRVAIGRAIVRDPKVFLFDEPLSNLDAKMRVEMRKEILQLHARLRSTMIYVTHDQVEAMTLGDRICVMNGGIMQQVGAPAAVFDDPANLFVAGFIGTPPMNLIPGTLVAQDDGIAFAGNGLSAPVPAAMRDNLSAHVGKQVVLGLRSRSLGLAGPDGNEAVWEAKRDVTEMLGEEAMVHMSLGDNKLVMSVEPHALDGLGDYVRIAPFMNRAHFFDGDSGANLTLGITLPGRRSTRK